MKKIMSTIMLLLVISSNFFYYSFADEDFETIEDNIAIEEEIMENDVILSLKEVELTEPETNDFFTEIESTDWQNKINFPLFKGDTGEAGEDFFEENKPEFNILESKLRENYSCDDCEELCNNNEDCILSCWDECEEDDWITDRSELEDWDNEDLPNLIISEVFFGWNNERIEIYNPWEDFQWDLVLSGIYNGKWTRFYPNISIENWATKIFGNPSADTILWNIDYIISDPTLRIWDNTTFLIQLYFSWILLDDFYWDSTPIDSNVSFHRIINTKEIFATTSDYSRNVTNEYLANPWHVFLQEIEPEIPDEPEDPELTWNTQETPNLKITEIYFDWDDNWFEITNLWNSDFSWDLTLNWNLNFTISTQIPVWISKVFANNLDMFETWENIEIIPNNISFNNEQINLNLIRSWENLDTFFVHESWVNYLQEAETSFEKVWNWSNWTTTYVGLNFDRIYNTNRWIAANPTTYFTQWENMKDVTKDRNWTEVYTGENYALPIDCDDFETDYLIDISEIYYWNEIYPSYVELKINDKISSYYNNILLSWTVLQSSISIRARQMKANTFFLVTSNSTRYDEWR